MKKLKYFIFILVIASLATFLVVPFSHANDADAKFGFIPGPIWYSKFPFFEGDKIRIYTAIYNNGENDLSGTVRFLNNENLISEVDFSVAQGVAIKEIWTDWTAEKGKHTINIELLNVKISKEGEPPSTITPENEKNAKSEIFVDGDNDSDGIGDIEDEDDDNDGETDIVEIKKGSDPYTDESIIKGPADDGDPGEAGAIEDLGDKLTSPIYGIKDTVAEYVDIVKQIPTGIFKSTIGSINSLADSQKDKLENKKINIEKKIFNLENIYRIPDLNKLDHLSSTSLNVATSLLNAKIDTKLVKKNKVIWSVKNFFNQMAIWSLKILILLLKYKIILYVVLFLIIYKILKFIVGLILYKN